MSAAEMARRAGLSKATLSQLEVKQRQSDDRHPGRDRDRPAHSDRRPAGP
ncbi:hypothetical protein HEP87_57630 [Streptomyces sp. S1D4-11]